MTNADLVRLAEKAENNCDWIEALFYYNEILLNTDNEYLIRSCIEEVQTINFIVESIEKGDKIRAQNNNNTKIDLSNPDLWLFEPLQGISERYENHE